MTEAHFEPVILISDIDKNLTLTTRPAWINLGDNSPLKGKLISNCDPKLFSAQQSNLP